MPKYDFICPEGHTKEVPRKVLEYNPRQYCREVLEFEETLRVRYYPCNQLMKRVYTTVMR